MTEQKSVISVEEIEAARRRFISVNTLNNASVQAAGPFLNQHGYPSGSIVINLPDDDNGTFTAQDVGIILNMITRNDRAAAKNFPEMDFSTLDPQISPDGMSLRIQVRVNEEVKEEQIGDPSRATLGKMEERVRRNVIDRIKLAIDRERVPMNSLSETIPQIQEAHRTMQEEVTRTYIQAREQATKAIKHKKPPQIAVAVDYGDHNRETSPAVMAILDEMPKDSVILVPIIDAHVQYFLKNRAFFEQSAFQRQVILAGDKFGAENLQGNMVPHDINAYYVAKYEETTSQKFADRPESEFSEHAREKYGEFRTMAGSQPALLKQLGFGDEMPSIGTFYANPRAAPYYTHFTYEEKKEYDVHLRKQIIEAMQTNAAEAMKKGQPPCCILANWEFGDGLPVKKAAFIQIGEKDAEMKDYWIKRNDISLAFQQASRKTDKITLDREKTTPVHASVMETMINNARTAYEEKLASQSRADGLIKRDGSSKQK